MDSGDHEGACVVSVRKTVVPKMQLGVSRILKAAFAAGVTATSATPFADVQKFYFGEFGVSLNQMELKKYFGCRYAKVVIVQWMKDYFFIPPEFALDSVLMIQLREPWEVIKKELHETTFAWDKTTLFG